MEANKGGSDSLAPTLEPLRLGGLSLFRFIPLTLTKEKHTDMREENPLTCGTKESPLSSITVKMIRKGQVERPFNVCRCTGR
jgi:hypothetical protein